jgi:hypothetical protein
MSRALARRAPAGQPVAAYVDVPGYVPALVSFLRRRVAGKAGARMDWAEVYREFAGPGTGWGSTPSPRAVAAALTYLCECYGVRVEVIGRNVYCVDCELLR